MEEVSCYFNHGRSCPQDCELHDLVLEYYILPDKLNWDESSPEGRKHIEDKQDEIANKMDYRKCKNDRGFS